MKPKATKNNNKHLVSSTCTYIAKIATVSLIGLKCNCCAIQSDLIYTIFHYLEMAQTPKTHYCILADKESQVKLTTMSLIFNHKTEQRQILLIFSDCSI